MTNAPIPVDVDALAREIVDAAIKVHKSLGPGLLESVYEQRVVHELTKRVLRHGARLACRSSTTAPNWMPNYASTYL